MRQVSLRGAFRLRVSFRIFGGTCRLDGTLAYATMRKRNSDEGVQAVFLKRASIGLIAASMIAAGATVAFAMGAGGGGGAGGAGAGGGAGGNGDGAVGGAAGAGWGHRTHVRTGMGMGTGTAHTHAHSGTHHRTGHIR